MSETNKNTEKLSYEDIKELYESIILAEPDDQTFYKRYLELLVPIFISLLSAIIVFSTGIGGDRQKSVQKELVAGNIATAISNDSDLRSVKQIFANRDLKRKKLFSFGEEDGVYKESVPLSVVLEDIRANLFLIEKPDLELVNKIDKIILDHHQTNPFDRLDEIQKDMFINIRLKLPEDYQIIQNDINKIADEINVKNQLVDKYLDRSTMSFWVSISALVFSISIAILQLYQNRPKKLHEIINNVITAALKNISKNK